MKVGQRRLDNEVDVVMEQGRQIRPPPDVVRARLLARAQAASRVLSPPVRALTPGGGRGGLLAVVAGALLAFGAAGAVAAVYSHVTRVREIAAAPLPVAEAPAASAPALGFPGARLPELVPSARPPRRLRAITPRESYAAEVQLLQRAQSEYSSHDFDRALALLAEHRRRFPNGRLAEEREALHVVSLARAGREDEMRAALVAFSRRFPRSLLLPGLREAYRSAE